MKKRRKMKMSQLDEEEDEAAETRVRKSEPK